MANDTNHISSIFFLKHLDDYGNNSELNGTEYTSCINNLQDAFMNELSGVGD